MKLLGFIILLVISRFAYSQSVEFVATAPSVVAVGERFKLSYTINKEGTNLQVPTLEGFDLLMGPSSSQSSSVTVINGKVTQNSSYTYTYLLEGVKEGTFQFAPATIMVEGKQYKSNGLRIQVVKGNGGGGSASSQDRGQAVRPDDAAAINEDNLFLKVDVSRHSLYQGESLVATIKIYTKVDLTNFGRSKMPAFDGFLSEDMSPQRIELVRENYNGQIYNVGVIRRVLLFPQHTGNITIDPVELECIVRQRVTGSRGMLDDFFGNYREVKVMRRSKPVTVQVRELPQQGKPLGFSGTVGNIALSTSVSADTVNANDALTYRVTFQGTGNLKLLQAPKINFPPDFEMYDPKESRDVQTNENGMSGSVTFEYLAIPRYSGEYKIPALMFSFFDSQTNSYKTLSGNEYNIFVRKGAEKGQAGNNAGGAVQSFKKEDVRFVGEDIRYLKTDGLHLKEIGVRFFGTLKYWLALLIPLVLFVVGCVLNRRRIKANADLVKMKNKTANKMARKRMKVAARAMKIHDVEQFYEEVLNALWGYVSFKLNVDRVELNRENISDILMKKGVEEGKIKEFVDVLNTCEYARYAPGSDPDQQMDKVYSDSIEVITRLDKAIK